MNADGVTCSPFCFIISTARFRRFLSANIAFAFTTFGPCVMFCSSSHYSLILSFLIAFLSSIFKGSCSLRVSMSLHVLSSLNNSRLCVNSTSNSFIQFFGGPLGHVLTNICHGATIFVVTVLFTLCAVFWVTAFNSSIS